MLMTNIVMQVLAGASSWAGYPESGQLEANRDSLCEGRVTQELDR